MDEREPLQKEIQTATDYIIQLEEKYYQSNQTCIDLLQKMRDHENEVETLKTYVRDVTARFNVYIANKTDAIDAKLGQYLNAYPDKRKLKFTFMRQGQGTYVFGSRLVNVTTSGNEIQVKTEGKTMPIGEFIDDVTPQELRKFECREPINRLTGKGGGGKDFDDA